ncbi:MAG: helix-turn-helix domain-containing protein [Clostridiales bacterium]|nr:helix-turn-helix domain-containing protein [Clostridiales bacterium]
MRYEIHGYKPIQPFIENKTCFLRHSIPVRHPIHDLVWEFYQYETSGLQAEEVSVVPDACADMLFCYDSNGLTSFIVGGPFRISTNRYDQKTTVFGIRFVTGSEFSICGVPVHGHPFEHMICRDINSKFREWDERMTECVTFDERVSFCEKKISSLLMTRDEVPLLVRFAVTAIINNEGNLKISRLADQSGYSVRYIEKQFNEYIGLEPKKLCEIVRFQNALTHLIARHGDKLSDIAWDAGYYDLSHMNKSYRQMTSALPRDVTGLLDK